MTCNTCGRTSMNEHANFCDYCGTSLKEAVYIESNHVDKENDKKIVERDKTLEEQPSANELSFKNWFSTLLIPVIPIIGPVMYVILMFVWAIHPGTNKTKKNWSRASLIVGSTFFVILMYNMYIFMETMISYGFDVNRFVSDALSGKY